MRCIYRQGGQLLIMMFLLLSLRPAAFCVEFNTHPQNISVIIHTVEDAKRDGLQFTVDLINNADTALEVSAGGTDPPFAVYIYNAEGAFLNAYEHTTLNTSDIPPAVKLKFAPQEKKNYVVVMREYKDAKGTSNKFPPGTYKVVAVFTTVTWRKSKGQVEPELDDYRSDPVAITVVQ